MTSRLLLTVAYMLAASAAARSDHTQELYANYVYASNTLARYVKASASDGRLALVPANTLALVLQKGTAASVRICEGTQAGKTGLVHSATVFLLGEQNTSPEH